MPRVALAKVAKKIRKKRGALDNLGDREAARYNRAALREQKLKKNAKTRNGMREIDSTCPFSVALGMTNCGFSDSDWLLQSCNKGCFSAT
jgi:hypothetical protein